MSALNRNEPTSSASMSHVAFMPFRAIDESGLLAGTPLPSASLSHRAHSSSLSATAMTGTLFSERGGSNIVSAPIDELAHPQPEQHQQLQQSFESYKTLLHSQHSQTAKAGSSGKIISTRNVINTSNTVTAIVQPKKPQTKQFVSLSKLKNVRAASGTGTSGARMNPSSDANDNDDRLSVSSQRSSSTGGDAQQQQQQQSSNNANDNKYNLSNLLKHIYELKNVQKSSNGSKSPPALPFVQAAAAGASQTNSSSSAVGAASIAAPTASSKQFWMPDDQVKECFECNEKFTTFRRRHHCRVCGQIFCGKCSDHEIPSQLIWPNSTGNIRACNFCHSFVAQMEHGDLKHNTKSIRELMKRLALTPSTFSPFGSTNPMSQPQGELLLDQVQQQLMMVGASGVQTASGGGGGGGASSMSDGNFSSVSSLASLNGILNSINSGASATSGSANSATTAAANGDDRNPFDVTENKGYFGGSSSSNSSSLHHQQQHQQQQQQQDYEGELRQLIMNNALELRNLWVQIYHTSDGLAFQAQRSVTKFKKVTNCVTGSELVEWLMRKKSVSRDQAIVIGQALVHGKWLECVHQYASSAVIALSNNSNSNSSSNNTTLGSASTNASTSSSTSLLSLSPLAQVTSSATAAASTLTASLMQSGAQLVAFSTASQTTTMINNSMNPNAATPTSTSTPPPQAQTAAVASSSSSNIELSPQSAAAAATAAAMNNQVRNNSNHQQQVFYDDLSLYRPGPTALNCNRSDTELFVKQSKELLDPADEGPEWIRELNKLVAEDAAASAAAAASSSRVTGGHSKTPSSVSVGSVSSDTQLGMIAKQQQQQQNATIGGDKLPPIGGPIPASGDANPVAAEIGLPLVKINKSKATFVDTNNAPLLKNMTVISGGGGDGTNSTTTMTTTTTTTTTAVNKSMSQKSLVASTSSTSSSPAASALSSLPTVRTLNNVNDDLQHVQRHLQCELLRQLLKLKHVSADWFDVIMPLVWKSVELVKPDVKHDNDSMDIRNYIKIKKLPGGLREHSRLVNGLVFSKHVAHRRMSSAVRTPRVLLLRSAIEYQRGVEHERMCSLEPLFAAEAQYLHNYCSKLVQRQNPSVLVVERSVARLAQEHLLAAGVSLVLNVKSSIVDKLCRFLQAEPMYSIDDPVRKAKLGFCSSFHVDQHALPGGRCKSLMFFEGTPTNLGCTVLLSGAGHAELQTIKQLTRFMIYVAYNAKLEHSFLLDKYADFSVRHSLLYAECGAHGSDGGGGGGGSGRSSSTSLSLSLSSSSESTAVAADKTTSTVKIESTTATPTTVAAASAVVVVMAATEQQQVTSPMLLHASASKKPAVANRNHMRHHAIKQEISVDESPLTSFPLFADDEVEADVKQAPSDAATKSSASGDAALLLHDTDLTPALTTLAIIDESGRSCQIAKPPPPPPLLKLTICEQHREKSAMRLNRSFKLLVDDLLLSCSPFVVYQMPFLLTEEAYQQQQHKYLPAYYMNYLKSNILLRDSNENVCSTSTTNNNNNSNNNSDAIAFSSKIENSASTPSVSSSMHDFLLFHLTRSFDDDEVKRLYADYRSRGGIASTSASGVLSSANAAPNASAALLLSLSGDPKLGASQLRTQQQQQQQQHSLAYDCLDIWNRQHLAVLFCTQCETSPVYPNLCHSPRVIDMKFYGENDMTLGNFLAKNCFRQGHKCNNELCDTLIVNHTRSFVHADQKITVRMSVMPSGNLSSQQQQQQQQQPQQSQTTNQGLVSNTSSASLSSQSNTSSGSNINSGGNNGAGNVSYKSSGKEDSIAVHATGNKQQTPISAQQQHLSVSALGVSYTTSGSLQRSTAPGLKSSPNILSVASMVGQTQQQQQQQHQAVAAVPKQASFAHPLSSASATSSSSLSVTPNDAATQQHQSTVAQSTATTSTTSTAAASAATTTKTTAAANTAESAHAAAAAAAAAAVVYDDINIFMWSVCRVCNKSTKKLTMSPHTWSFSLAKFLEITFHARTYTQLHDTAGAVCCRHSLFADHYQCFRFKNIITVFSSSKITICALSMPPQLLKSTSYARSRSDYINDIKDLFEKGLFVFSSLVERIQALKALNLSDKQVQKLDQFIAQINSDTTLRNKIETINLLLTNQLTPVSDSDKVIGGSGAESSNSSSDSNTGSVMSAVSTLTQESTVAAVDQHSANNDSASLSSSSLIESSEKINYDQIEMLLIELRKYIAASVTIWNAKMSEFFKKSKLQDESADLLGNTPGNVTLTDGSVRPNGIIVGSFRATSSSMPLAASHLQAREDECILGKQLGTLAAISAIDNAAATATDKVYGFTSENIAGAPSPSSSASRQSTAGQNLEAETSSAGTTTTTTGAATSVSNSMPTAAATPSSAISIGKRFIANLIPSSAFPPLKIPFADDEHYLTGYESSYYVNDKNLSSIVAFTLSSKEYRDYQTTAAKIDLVKLMQYSQMSGSSATLHATTKDNTQMISSAMQDIDDYDVIEQSGPTPSTINKPLMVIHFEHQFNDSTAKFYCKAYYAELFSRLRKLIMPHDEEKYIHSLFRCMNWDAKGGKSNSQFRKTLDNRFVLKEMSKMEVQSFIDFAPQYVQHVSNCIQSNKPTALTKILGAYKICYIKNQGLSTKAVKMDVIVMENLFYNKKFTHVFDLKGSERNRLINVQQHSSKSQEKDLVLLDENFLIWTFDDPIYIKPHAKYVLMKAIEADSQFLSTKFVMDYSLLLGFNQMTNEIVIGIIDYLRVFTWDKKVETYLKSTISGQGKMPTIVSPEVYRTRFINALDRYFLEVPDQWYQDRDSASIS